MLRAQEIKLKVPGLALGQGGHERLPPLSDMQGRQFNDLEILCVDDRHAGGKVKFWRAFGAFGSLWLRRGGGFPWSSCRYCGPSSLSDLDKTPLIERCIGIVGVQEGEFRVV